MREHTALLPPRCCYAVARHNSSRAIMSNTSPQTVRLDAPADCVSNCVRFAIRNVPSTSSRLLVRYAKIYGSLD